MAIAISFTETAALVYGEKHFPVKTPRRWHLIAEYVSKCTQTISQQGCTHTPVIFIGKEGLSPAVTFQSTAPLCKTAFEMISSLHQELLRYSQVQADSLFADPSMSAFKPVVLLPKILHCCDKPVYL